MAHQHHRKPPPPLQSPPPQLPQQTRQGRRTSMQGQYDEDGRPVAWGAMSGAGYAGGGGMMEERDITGVGRGEPQLSNFEAAVAALRATAPTPALSTVSAVPSSQTHPSDPNYPSSLQFHPAPAYSLHPSHRTQSSTTSSFNNNNDNRPPSFHPNVMSEETRHVPLQAPIPSAGPSFYERTRNFLGGRGYYSGDDSGGNAALLRDDQENEEDIHLPSPVTNTKHRRGNNNNNYTNNLSRNNQTSSYPSSGPNPYPDSPHTPSMRRRSQRSRSATPEIIDGGDSSMLNTPIRTDPFSRVDVTGGRGGEGGGGLGLAARVTRGLAEKGYGRYDSPEKNGSPYTAQHQYQSRQSNQTQNHLYSDPPSTGEDADDKTGMYEFDLSEKVDYNDDDNLNHRHDHSPQDTLFETQQFPDQDNDDGEYGGTLRDSATQHFGPAPVGRVVRRHKQLNRKNKKVALSEGGNLVLDLKIPTKLESFLPVKGEEEMMYTKYSAVTCDPDEFINEGFELRQNINGRETELFVVITMFNEDEVLFCSTLYGVMKNIAHLTRRKNSPTWGPEGWKKVVVCIVADGRKHIHPRVLDCLATLGIYQEGAMKSSVQGKPVQAHVFEYTTSFSLTPSMKFKYPEQGNKGIVPVQILFCLKEQNKKKINSHRWFFNAFARSLEPKVCILLDVGTRPAEKALYHLWKAFDRGSNVGGACGEIATYKGKYWKGLLNPLAASQNFEYKTSNHLDKPTESVFGYLAVLPGAFSAYRWLAIQGQPLKSYFKGEVLTGADADTFTANMYLAEDRILCWEIVAKAKSQWVLKFVKAAVAETDCPETVAEFISQRRRWLNGSLFAAVYAQTHLFQIFGTDHSAFRKFVFLLQAAFNAVNLAFAWFSVANFYIFFVILTSSLEDSSFGIPNIKYLNVILQYTYLGVLIAVFLFSMGNRPKGSPWKYRAAIMFFAILTVYMLVCSVLCAVKVLKQGANVIVVRMMVSLISTYGVFVIAALLALDGSHILTCMVQYVLLQATYVNILNIYAFSNLHDLSWGTKGSDKTENDLGSVAKAAGGKVEVELLADQIDVDTAYSESLDKLRLRQPLDKSYGISQDEKVQRQKDYYANFRTNVLLVWALSNGLLASAILGGGGASTTFTSGASKTSIYMLATLVFMAGTAAVRLLGALVYAVMRPFGG